MIFVLICPPFSFLFIHIVNVIIVSSFARVIIIRRWNISGTGVEFHVAEYCFLYEGYSSGAFVGSRKFSTDIGFDAWFMVFGNNLFLRQATILESHKILVAHFLIIFLGAICKLHRNVALSLFVLIDMGGFNVDEGG